MKISTSSFQTLDRLEQKNIIETIIFAASSDENLTAENIQNIVLNESNNSSTKIRSIKTHSAIKEYIQNISSENQNDTENINGVESTKNIDDINDILIDKKDIFSEDDIIKIIDEINEDLENTNRPYRIVNFAGGYQFATLPRYGEFVENMLNAKVKKRFTSAQLETLAIIAYKQPVTKQEIDKIRGVMSSSEVLNVLIEKGLVEIAGRKEVIGKPLLYATTTDFLRTFGLNNLTDLPKLVEIEDIVEEKLRNDELISPDIVLDVSKEDVEELTDKGIKLVNIENNI